MSNEKNNCEAKEGLLKTLLENNQRETIKEGGASNAKSHIEMILRLVSDCPVLKEIITPQQKQSILSLRSEFKTSFDIVW